MEIEIHKSLVLFFEVMLMLKLPAFNGAVVVDSVRIVCVVIGGEENEEPPFDKSIT